MWFANRGPCQCPGSRFVRQLGGLHGVRVDSVCLNRFGNLPRIVAEHNDVERAFGGIEWGRKGQAEGGGAAHRLAGRQGLVYLDAAELDVVGVVTPVLGCVEAEPPPLLLAESPTDYYLPYPSSSALQ